MLVGSPATTGQTKDQVAGFCAIASICLFDGNAPPTNPNESYISYWVGSYSDIDGLRWSPDGLFLLFSYRKDVLVLKPNYPSILGWDAVALTHDHTMSSDANARWDQGIGACPMVTLVTSNPGYNQMAQDMLAIGKGSGLYIHAGPTFNAVKAKSSPTASDPDVILWGRSVTVTARMEFGTGALKQVWYEIDHPFGNFPDQKKGWIAGRINDKNYIGTNGDPCPTYPLPQTLTFPYDRVGATMYAVAHAYQNFTLGSLELNVPPQSTNPNAARVTGRYKSSLVATYIPSFTLIPFADIKYDPSKLSFSQVGKTGSTFFTSEAIWMGGLPMTRIEANDNQCNSASNQDGNTSSWRYCSNTKFSTIAWSQHQRLLTYYGKTILPGVSEINDLISGKGTKSTVIFRNAKRADAPSAFKSIAEDSFDIDSINLKGGGDIQLDKTGMSDWSKKVLKWLSAGDYVFIDSGPTAQQGVGGPDFHGFLVVGWGEVKTCLDALNSVYKLSTGSTIRDFLVVDLTRVSSPDVNVIPYVVDFPGVGKSGLQSSRPRPFYCSAYQDQTVNNPNRFADRHSWWFVQLPTAVSISPSQLGDLSNWTWTGADGVLP
jgi:hypothetical protein